MNVFGKANFFADYVNLSFTNVNVERRIKLSNNTSRTEEKK